MGLARIMYTNRLANEKSPYLLQHAHNPVDWYPWGEEALAKAKSENKPIFLSVGYATCHWCHVMERESFEQEGIAKIINEHFVAIKVDREERPDIDRIYMLFVQASTGSGGWPMSVWLTPEGKPFFGGTYFPPDNRFGRPGFGAILLRLAEAWRDDRPRIEQSGSDVMKQLADYSSLGTATEVPGREVWGRAYQGFRRAYDSQLGGFGSAPKFPRPVVLNFLLRYFKEEKNEEALEMVLKTLQEMAKGGMKDQIGGGFHRYSVDQHWFVPHFEKMLYDQSQLAISYLEAFQITRDDQYANAARDIFDYVLRDLTSPEGGFYSAEDADSAADPQNLKEKSEGAFYIWTFDEIRRTLGDAEAALFALRYGAAINGNVEEDPHGEFGGRNILYQAMPVDEVARRLEIRVDQAETSLRSSCQKLLTLRTTRPRPLLDDKILSSWNGMMISAFAKGAMILNEPRYAAAARNAARFVRSKLWDESRQILLRRYRDGESKIEGFLDDYAFMGLAFLDLYESSFEDADFRMAIRLAERACEQFEDQERGGFFTTQADAAIIRLKDDYDGAEPSANSAMVMLLLRLSRMTGNAGFLKSAEKALAAFTSRLQEAGTAVPQMLVSHLFALTKPMEIVFSGPEAETMLQSVRKRFLPNAIVMRAEQTDLQMPAIAGGATVYVCENFACKLPVTEVKALDQLLE